MTKVDLKRQAKCHIRKVIYDLYMTSELCVYHKPFGKRVTFNGVEICLHGQILNP